MFETELRYFVTHQAELVNAHRGKALMIMDEAVVGVYDSMLEAYLEAKRTQRIGSVMIQPCEPGPEAYTVTISPHTSVEH
ncbi:MAG: hypothetical protein ACYC5O_09500 [Anaerolineae bacterium]